jgi:pilus assembly protein CpaF
MQMPARLESLFSQGVTDVVLVGARNCYVDRLGVLTQVPSPFAEDSELSQLLIELALEAEVRLDLAKPLADFGIGNFRFSAQLKSAVSDVPSVTIRKHPKTPVTVQHLLAAGFVSELQLAFLGSALKAGKTLLISGPTASGKTTLLSALIRFAKQRVVAVEQTPELVLEPPSIKFCERPNNQQGSGLISQSDLLTAALRMRPDRVAIGEVRGAEFVSLLQAINNGHPALATIHARSIEDLPPRLMLLGQLAEVPSDSVAMLCQAIDYVVQLENVSGQRKISKIAKFNLEPRFGVTAIEV